MKNKLEIYRQGDVLIEKVERINVPFTAKTSYVLAYGEVTGHKHEVFSNHGTLGVTEINHEVYISIEGTNGIVKHEEHNPICLDSGHYKITIQEEYSPRGYRKVKD